MQKTLGKNVRRVACTALAAAAIIITLIMGMRAGLRLERGTYELGKSGERPLTLPLRVDSVAGQETFRIQMTMYVSPLHADRYRLYIDDCLKSMQINGITVQDPSIPFCGADSSLELRLGQYLHPGKNILALDAKDTGGIARFSIGISPLDPLRIFLTTLALVCGSIAAWCLWGHRLRTWKYRELGWFFAGGSFLRLLYVLSTPYMTRAHDGDAHIDYIRHVAAHFTVPPASGGWEFHQPPLYYFLSGGYVRLASLFGRDEGAALPDLQWFSLVCSVIALGAALWIGTMLFAPKEKRALWVYAGIVGVLPGFIFLSSRLSNDALFAALVFLLFGFLIRWWKYGKRRDWLAVAALAGLSFITKANVVPLLPVIGLCLFLRPKQRWQQSIALACYGTLVFAAIAGWLPLLRLLEEDPSRVIGFGNQGMNGALILGNDIRTYLTFSPIDMLLHPFNNPWIDDERRRYFWEFFVRSMLFGEFSFSMRWVSTVLLGLWLLMIPLFARGAWVTMRHSFMRSFPVFSTGISLMGAVMAYRFLHTCACNQDYRFVPLLLVPIAYLVARGTEGNWNRVLQTIAMAFVVTSAAFTIMLFFNQ